VTGHSQPNAEEAGHAASVRVSIVVPTYKEAESLPLLMDRVAKLRAAEGYDIELLIMDDDSRDGSREIIQARAEPWVQMVERTSDRGLSQSVLDGLRRAKGEFLVCMDADLSHPPEALPAMLAKLHAGADFVFGSRYVAGGTTSDDWGVLRWLNSRVATWLARPLTSAHDPMSGYFALRRETFARGHDFNPIGYKVALELIVKCACERVVEVPIHFEDRQFGKSKLTVRQQLLYLQHLRRLYLFKFGRGTELMQFLAVGALGAAVNLLVLTALLAGGAPDRPAVATAIFLSMCFNSALGHRLRGSVTGGGGWWRQWLGFLAASSIGGVVNYLAATLALSHLPGLRPQLAALIGIAAGTSLNFVASRYRVFRAAHVRVGRPPT
jgi:dolichol-phosphate mannosyltransferase